MLKLCSVIFGLALMASVPAFSFEKSKSFEVTPKTGIAPLEISLNAESLHQHAEIFIWNFGNGESLTTTNPKINYTFKNAGTFSVQLKYLKNKQDKLDKGKDGGVATIVVIPNKLPIPILNCNSDVINKIECNSVGSSDEDGTIATYKYEWGDGSSSIENAPGTVAHTYSSGGLKTLRLSVTDNKGGVAIVEKEILVKANTPPVANFTCQKTGIQQIHCESTSTDNEEELTNFSWTLDDGAAYTTSSFDHKFSRPQDVAITSHNVQLQVTDSLGLTSSTSQNVAVDLETIKEAPRGYFKIFEMGTTLELHSFIAKTQFAPKRAYYQIYGASAQELLQTIELSEFYPNTVVKADLGSFRNGRIFLTVVDWRDQVFKTSIPFSLVEETTTLKPHVEFRPIQSARRTVYLNLNPSFDFDLDFAIKSFIVNFGDGQQVELTNDTFLTHAYAVAGTYQVSVTAITNHNTQATLTKAVTVTDNDLPIVTPDATFGYRIFSFAQNVSFYNEKSGTPNGEIISYLWSFGDGTTGTGATQSHFYEPGTYLVSLTVTDTAGLTNTQTQKITIKVDGADLLAGIDCKLQLPYLDFVQKCKVLALDRFNEISRVRVLWGDGTVSVLGTPYDANQGIYFPTKKYTVEGVYAVKVVVNTTRGDVAGFETSLNIKARPPIASIQCYSNNLAVYCDALGSYDPKGTQLSYEFNLGNGHSEINSTGLITYAYSNAGLYDVSVKVTDAQGLFSIAKTKVQVVRPPNILPIADFNCDSPHPLTVYCWENGISDQDGFIVSKKLSFDDGDYGFLNPENSTRKQFATSGQHEVTLTVMDNDGGVRTVTKSFDVKVNNPPVASFECNTYGPQKMNCYSTSVDPDNGDWVSSFDWDFGDGTIQTGLSGAFDHVYGANPVYTVKLTVHDQYGKSSTTQKDITMIKNQAPVASINCFVTTGTTYQCNSNAYDPDGLIVEKNWTIEGQNFSGFTALYNFTNGGIFPVSLTIVDDLGKTTSVSINLNVNKPIGNLTCTKLSNYKVRCDATTSIGTSSNNLLSYKISFDNDFISDEAQAEYEFQSSGPKLIKLEIKDEFNNISQTESVVQIAPFYTAPVPYFIEFVEVGRVTRLDASLSLLQDRLVTKYEWNFGDGSTLVSNEPKVQHIFQQNTHYTVELKVTDATGVQAIYSKEIYINDPQVLDPGSQGRMDLLGIDFDNDGIRDDVQRWIQAESKDNIVKKKYLRSIAMIYEENFRNLDNLQSIYNNFSKLGKLEQCIKLTDSDPLKNDQIKSLFRIAYANTDARFLAANKIDASHAGQSIAPDMTNVELEIFCEEAH